jgi:hypothetical protein
MRDYYEQPRLYKRIWNIITLVLVVILLIYLNFRYSQFKAYRGYIGTTANQGFLNSVFEFFTLGKRGDI